MKELENKIIAYLKKRLESARFKHTLGACRIACELAEKNNLAEYRARIAALLHDAGKSYNKKEMIKYVSRRRVKVPYKKLVIEHSPSLLHSYISADIAKRVFGIRDTSILRAISEHTVGAENMSLLSKIIYVSDSVTFDRKYPGVKELRRLAYRNIDSAVRSSMANKLYYVIKKNKWLHPGAVKAWNSIIAEKQDYRPKTED